MKDNKSQPSAWKKEASSTPNAWEPQNIDAPASVEKETTQDSVLDSNKAIPSSIPVSPFTQPPQSTLHIPPPVPASSEELLSQSQNSKRKFLYVVGSVLAGIILIIIIGCSCFFAGRYFSSQETASSSEAESSPTMQSAPQQATTIPQTQSTAPKQSEPSQPTGAETKPKEPAPTESDPAETESADTVPEQVPIFEPYLIAINTEYFELPVYDIPTFQGEIISSVTETGTYTITEEQTEQLSNGFTTIWGKLKSGIGWINLIDASGEYPPPLNCQDCKKSHQETSISRYGYCDPCHEKNGVADYGDCDICGRPIESVASTLFDGRRCFNCQICDYCGVSIQDWEYYKAGEYMCGDCYTQIYLLVGSCYYCGDVCDVLTGVCEACYEATVYCQICGYSCGPYDSDGICDNCVSESCHFCGGPLGADHNCDDYPNVICPNCNWGIYTSGVGTDGWDCPECGTNIIPPAG